MFKRLRRLTTEAFDRDSDREDRGTYEKEQIDRNPPPSRRNSTKLLVSRFLTRSLSRHGEDEDADGGQDARDSGDHEKRGSRHHNRLSQDRDRVPPVLPTYASEPTPTSSSPPLPPPTKTLRRVSTPSPLRAHTVSTSSNPSHSPHAHFHEHQHGETHQHTHDSNKPLTHSSTAANPNSPSEHQPPRSPRSLRRTTRISASSVSDSEQRRQIAIATGIAVPWNPSSTASTTSDAPVRRHSNPAKPPEFGNRGTGTLKGAGLGLGTDKAVQGLSLGDKEGVGLDAQLHLHSHRRTRSSGSQPLPTTLLHGSPAPTRSNHKQHPRNADRDMPRHSTKTFVRPDNEPNREHSDDERTTVIDSNERPPPLPPKDERWSSDWVVSYGTPPVDVPHAQNLHYSGVKFQVAEREAEAYKRHGAPIGLPEQILRQVWQKTTGTEENGVWVQLRCKELLHSSFGRPATYGRSLASFVPQKNGFVHTVLDAYNYHHHLVIRPDDLWIAVLSQLNLYVNAHAEDLRHILVAHEGKKTLEVVSLSPDNRYTADFGWFTKEMGDLLRSQIKDARFADFVIPSFSTTTDSDVIVASAMMMSTLKAYFSYVFSLRCGIPTVTVLGTKSDYDDILARLSCLLPAAGDPSDSQPVPVFDLGKETQAFAYLLRPVIKKFAAAFDSVGDRVESTDGSKVASVTLSADGHDFWGRICHVEDTGSGPSYLSGWLSAFCVWDDKGAWQGPDPDEIVRSASPAMPMSPRSGSSRARPSMYGSPPPLRYAGLEYPVVDLDKIPPGFCDVDVLLNDNGSKFECMLVAGHIGMNFGTHQRMCESRGGANDERNGKADTLRPAPQWFMFVKEKKEGDRWGRGDDSD